MLFLAVFLLTGAGIWFFAIKNIGIRELLRNALTVVDAAGPFGPMIFLGIFTVACIFLLPTFYLTIGAGTLFGLWKGSIVASLSVAAGAAAAFLSGRYFFRDCLVRLFGGNALFLALDEAAAREGWKIVFLTRLSPAFPFNILNYAFGLSSISFLSYFLASWAGSIPWTIMYVSMGSLAADLAGLHSGGPPRSGSEWILALLGLAASAGGVILTARIAGKALKGRLASSDKKEHHPGDQEEHQDEQLIQPQEKIQH